MQPTSAVAYLCELTFKAPCLRNSVARGLKCDLLSFSQENHNVLSGVFFMDFFWLVYLCELYDTSAYADSFSALMAKVLDSGSQHSMLK